MIKYNKNMLVVDGPPWKDRTARWLALGIIRAQSAIATRLQSWEKKLSRSEKKLLLVLFCLFSGGYCLCLLGSALYGKTPRPHPALYPAAHLTVIAPFPEEGYGRPYADTLRYPVNPTNLTSSKNKAQ